MQLCARKSMNYATRALKAGDVFAAPQRDARILIAIGKADPAPVDPMEELRKEAAALGVKVDARWGEARLRAEIEKAQE